MNISKVKLLIAALILTTANLASADNKQIYVALDNSIESSICVAAATASKLRMHAKVKQISSSTFMSKKYELVANEMTCNGINVADFAAQAGNIEVANKLMSYRRENVEIRDLIATYKAR